jgi:hypothetical protein
MSAWVPVEEDEWVGGVLSFGDSNGVAVAITNYDQRCSMVTLDPDSAGLDPEVLKTIVRVRNNGGRDIREHRLPACIIPARPAASVDVIKILSAP